MNRRGSLLLLLGLLAFSTTACVDAESAELSSESQDVGVCPGETVPIDSGPSYTYSVNGANFRWEIVKQPNTPQVGYHNYRIGGPFSVYGTISRWSTCPSAPTPIQIINHTNGNSFSCKQICLPNGKVEVNCPHIQFIMTQVNEQRCFNVPLYTATAAHPCDLEPTKPECKCDKWKVDCVDPLTAGRVCAQHTGSEFLCGMGAGFALFTGVIGERWTERGEGEFCQHPCEVWQAPGGGDGSPPGSSGGGSSGGGGDPCTKPGYCDVECMHCSAN